MDKLEMLCRPLIDYLKEKHDPYTEIVVTMDSVTVKQCIEEIPTKNK